MAFNSVLVANRGEIALRVIAAARKAGMVTAAVYSDADRHSPHVRAADRAVRIGPAPASQSYLDIEAVVAAALRTGAEAVHPGYGFLAENASLARACAQAGVCFVGPSAEVIEQMGSKARARALAQDADVPVIGALEDEGDESILARAGAEVGFPLMVKAAAGGGGKGMRAVFSQQQLAEALQSARREARAAFGDDTLLIERLIERPRHVEVQVLGDSYGHVVHLFERDCSVQRRHQKVVEEAPAPTISRQLRGRLCSAAVALARAVGYENAGTVEFLVEADSFYFLEMNTRLQVEHPVTECVTGVDIVDYQLRIAAGESLDLDQQKIQCQGHAIEVRLYAEDPRQGFLPQAGAVTEVRWPASVRIDSAIEAGQHVGTYYDPMLAKVTSYGPTRESAQLRLVDALDHCAIFGLTTNCGFLRSLVQGPEFGRAEIDTTWLDQPGAQFQHPSGREARYAAAWHRATAGADPTNPFDLRDGWRVTGPPAPVPIELVQGGSRVHLAVDRATETIDDGGVSVTIRPVCASDSELVLEIEGELQTFYLRASADELCVVHQGEMHQFRPAELLVDAPDSTVADGVLVAPMPASVLEVRVQSGASVRKGQSLLVLEAMKMEIAVSAPFDGVMARQHVRAGQQVSLGEVLAEVEPEGGDV